MLLLLDPRLLRAPTRDAPDTEWLDFWTRLSGWTEDARVRAGAWTASLANERYADLGWPQTIDPYPRELSPRDLHRIICRFTANAATTEDAGHCIVDFDPNYQGDDLETMVLGSDLAANGEREGRLAIASAVDSWDPSANVVDCAPPPPSTVSLVYEPHASFTDERAGRARERLSEGKLRIVGGRCEDRILVQLEERLGITDVDWIPSECGHAPPLGRWESCACGADDRALVCITGLIGHAASTRAERCANRLGLAYFPVRRPSGIVDALVDRFGDA